MKGTSGPQRRFKPRPNARISPCKPTSGDASRQSLERACQSPSAKAQIAKQGRPTKRKAPRGLARSLPHWRAAHVCTCQGRCAPARRPGCPAGILVPAQFDGRRSGVALPEVKPLQAGNAPAGIRISPRVPLNTVRVSPPASSASLRGLKADVSTDFRPGSEIAALDDDEFEICSGAARRKIRQRCAARSQTAPGGKCARRHSHFSGACRWIPCAFRRPRPAFP